MQFGLHAGVRRSSLKGLQPVRNKPPSEDGITAPYDKPGRVADAFLEHYLILQLPMAVPPSQAPPEMCVQGRHLVYQQSIEGRGVSYPRHGNVDAGTATVAKGHPRL